MSDKRIDSRPDSALEWTLDKVRSQSFDNENQIQGNSISNSANNNIANASGLKSTSSSLNANANSFVPKQAKMPTQNEEASLESLIPVTSIPVASEPTPAPTSASAASLSLSSTPALSFAVQNNGSWKPQAIQEQYRTFSFDARMLRNQNEYDNNINSNNNNNNNHTKESIPHHRTHSRHSSITLPPSPNINQNTYLRSHSAQASDNVDEISTELKGLLPPQNQRQITSYSSYGDTDYAYDDPSKKQLLQQQQIKKHKQKVMNSQEEKKKSASKNNSFFYYIVYALLNTMMSIPGLYGYASVIFNHDIFQPHIATLSKLVIWSSAVHQFTFVAISSISFAKAEVQDAGLLFLSCMTHFVADRILNDQGTIEEIISTTVITLGIATASLGVILMLMGRFKCADVVSYLPLPVVGGYLAFIGYFCVIAGVGLCISKSMIDGGFFADMQLLSDKKSLVLAIPGLVAGFIMMIVSRYATSDIALPMVMVMIPSMFYIVLYCNGYTMDDARENNWVGEVTPPASISALFELFDLNVVRWDLVFSRRVFTVWLGMVFVVSFSSCLDVAAISMDMGEPLNVNKELITVGLSNVLSGLTFGQTGSYIFSQTIMTYRTGFHSRWIGFLCGIGFIYFVVSKVNLLEIAPLFFLGSTLIFIGIDLLYEWLIEVAHKLLLSEYLVLVATFIAIQFLGIDAGIILGVVVAVVEYVITTSQQPSLRRVLKRSTGVWEPQHRKLLQDIVYDSRNPKIITLEITETVFFGSSLQLFSQICDEIGISATPSDIHDMILASPARHTSRSPGNIRQKRNGQIAKPKKIIRPRFVVLEMTQVANVDASAARTCFFQLANMCSKNGIVLCATGVNRRVDWILRSHDVSYTSEEEEIVKSLMLNPLEPVTSPVPSGKLILFSSVNECLELCENQLIYEYEQSNLMEPPKLRKSTSTPDLASGQQEDEVETKIPLSRIFGRILGLRGDRTLLEFDCGGAARIDEIELSYGQQVFAVDDTADSFYVVLCGSVGICRTDPKLKHDKRSNPEGESRRLADVVSYLSVGRMFGYVDFAIQRRRSFNAVSSIDGTVIAKISRTTIDRLKNENETLHHIIEKVLLQASLMELANIEVS